MNIFMQATKLKLRFATRVGTLTTECLWDLPIEDLDSLVIQLRDEAKASEAEGYLSALSQSTVDVSARLRFQVAESIILARVEEIKEREQAMANKQKRARLLSIIASKEAQELEGKDIEALRTMAEDLA